MSYQVVPIANSYAEIGKNPHWDEDSQSLFYADLNQAKVLRYDYSQNKIFTTNIPNEDCTSFVVPIAGTKQKFAVGCDRRILLICWDGSSKKCAVERTLFEIEPENKSSENRFNDAKCDPQGRLFAGTMAMGELYKYERGGRVLKIKNNAYISNGIAWNDNTKKFYSVDASNNDIKEYDYDLQKGEVFNPKVVYDLKSSKNKKNYLQPDGMAIDTAGNIFVAIANGNSIHKVNPKNGEVLLNIELPCKQITSVTFGGPKMDELFVTTAAVADEPEPAGSLFKVTNINSRGVDLQKMQI